MKRLIRYTTHCESRYVNKWYSYQVYPTGRELKYTTFLEFPKCPDIPYNNTLQYDCTLYGTLVSCIRYSVSFRTCNSVRD